MSTGLPANLERVHNALRALGSRPAGQPALRGDWACPVHTDARPSMGVALKDDGGILFHCPVCQDDYSTNAEFTAAVLARTGLSWADVQPPSSVPELQTEYAYERVDGHYLFSVFRFHPKTFKQGVVVSRAPFVVDWSVKGLRLVPFHLPALKSALEAGRDVFVAEGEGDVLALERAGVTATCNPGGAGKWTAEHSEHFRGSASRVIVVPDWDEHGKGQRHALAVAESLRAVGVEAEFRRAAKGKDARDHLNAGGTTDDLLPVSAGELAAFSAKPDQEAVDAERRRRQVRRAVDAEEALSDWEPPPSHEHMGLELDLSEKAIDWTVEGLHERGTNTLVVAGYKTGKTVLALNLLKRLVDNEDFLGHKTLLPDDGRRVAWWNYELTDHQARRWVRELGVEHPERLSHLPLRGYSLPLQVDQIVDWSVEWLRSRSVKVLVVDPFAEAYDGDENDNSAVRVWLQNLNEIKRRAGVEDVFLIVHTGHAEQEEGRERARGASRLEGWKDVGWYYTKIATSDDLRFLRAFGRDVDVANFAVRMDPATRLLSRDEATTGMSRDQVVAHKKAKRVAQLVAQEPGITKTALRQKLGRGGNTEKDEWIEAAVHMGLVRTEAGKQRALLHYPTEQKKFDITELLDV